MSILSVKKVEQSYAKRRILKGVSLDANVGEIVSFLGPNGAGKTTLLKTIIGLLPISKYHSDKGTNGIFFDGHLINKWPIAKRVEKGLVYLPQHTSLFENLTLKENLKLVYEYHSFWRKMGQTAEKNKHYDVSPISRKKQFEEEMEQWIKRANLTDALPLQGYQLSGGQKRKAEVIRALLMHPKVIILDEPFAGVDPKSIYELKSIFVDLAKKGISILISDHNVDQLLSIADLIYVLIEGEVVVSGGIKEVMSNEYTQEMYLGKQFHSEMAEKFLWENGLDSNEKIDDKE